MATIYSGAHTPGPWRVGDAGFTVFGPNLGKPSPEIIATVRKGDNARRIAACVNACEGISTKALKQGASGAIPQEVQSLRAEVAALREALHSCKVQTWSNQEEGLDAAVYMRETARAALKAAS